MSAPTASTTLHNNTGRLIATPGRTWAQRILTEVGSELLERVQLIMGDWGASTHVELDKLINDFCGAIIRLDIPNVRYFAGRLVRHVGKAVALRLVANVLGRAQLSLIESTHRG